MSHWALPSLEDPGVRALLDATRDQILVYTLGGRIVLANARCCEINGIDRDHLDELEDWAWVPEARLADNERMIATLADTGSAQFEYSPETPEGRLRFEVSARLADVGGETVVMSVARDRTKESQALEDLLLRSLLLDQANDAIVVYDMDGRIRYANESACLERGYTRDEYLALSLDELLTERPGVLMPGVFQQLASSGCATYEAEELCKDGSVIPVEVRARLVKDAAGTPLVVTVARDLRERRRAEAEIAHLAFYDALTGLPNRRLFNDRLEVALSGARRRGETLAVLFLDVDNLKTVNDTLGHDCGDALLVEVAQRASALVRDADTVARLAGDEFTILLSATDGFVAEGIAERLLEVMREPFQICDHDIAATMCIGVAIAESPDVTADELIRNADLAMYQVKSTSRDGYAVYDEQMSTNALTRFEMLNDMRNAIANDEFTVAYQPQVRIDSREIVGVEALLRWSSAKHGTIAPSAFIPLAEESGLIRDLGAWVLDRALADHAQWCAAGVRVRIGVNVSPSQIVGEQFVGIVERSLKKHGTDPSLLELELTEGAALGGTPHVRETLQRIAQLGVRFAIDDFGTGYSSLGHLHSLPVSTIKVDRKFVAAMDDPVQPEVAGAIVTMGHRLGLHVVAEGVETDGQLAVLRDLDCKEFQGFLFSPAVPSSEIAELLGVKTR